MFAKGTQVVTNICRVSWYATGWVTFLRGHNQFLELLLREQLPSLFSSHSSIYGSYFLIHTKCVTFALIVADPSCYKARFHCFSVPFIHQTAHSTCYWSVTAVCICVLFCNFFHWFTTKMMQIEITIFLSPPVHFSNNLGFVLISLLWAL